MNRFHVAAAWAALLWTVSHAGAQYGLYGSPELLRLPPQTAGPAHDRAGPAAYQAVAAAPVPTLAPTPVASSYTSFTVQNPEPPPDLAPQPLVEPPRHSSPSVVEQMLQEPGGCGGYPQTGSGGGCGGGVYDRALSRPCGMDGFAGGSCCTPLWYVRGGGLIMGRNEANNVWTSFEADNNANQLMRFRDAHSHWQGGWEISLGRYLCCYSWAVEATYWGMVNMEGNHSITHPDGVSTPFDFTDVVYADPAIIGLPVELFDGAVEHRVHRENNYHSAELNFIHRPLPSGCETLHANWMAGFRYFRFDEELMLASRDHAGAWGADLTREGYLSDRVENNLYGFQLGFNLDYALGCNLSLFCTPKVGIYNNHVWQRFEAYRGDGAVFGPNPAPPVGDPVAGSYPVTSQTDDLAFMTQIDLGVNWQFARCWEASIGYRVLIATGVALADNQFPHYVVDIPEIADIDTNGDLILHGGFASLTYRY